MPSLREMATFQIITENRFAFVAPGSEVVTPAGPFDARCAGHTAVHQSRNETPILKCLMLRCDPDAFGLAYRNALPRSGVSSERRILAFPRAVIQAARRRDNVNLVQQRSVPWSE